ncbi:hypothetical protein R5H32_19375 [Defluviimonas sp. D31]|uniref:hypothetical protein n=1 Tax=Defluviimonas sp. D31 TaxID=3083253 RepID=UPI00296FF61C|nr:hypothetical protein [Defluviimonas sp. D31]MDW4551512.1 hypothetical protein [Defluviimonas sp. D31]
MQDVPANHPDENAGEPDATQARDHVAVDVVTLKAFLETLKRATPPSAEIVPLFPAKPAAEE